MKLSIFCAGLLTLAVMASNLHAASQAGEKRELLSKHETVAQFDGTSFHRCMGLTSLCPDRCGHSGDMATFRILKYLAYEKPGQYGDAKQDRHMFLVQDNQKQPKIPAKLLEQLNDLKKGDYVLLSWHHEYVTKGGASFPERTVTKLVKITREEAGKHAGDLDKLPAPATPPGKPQPRR